MESEPSDTFAEEIEGRCAAFYLSFRSPFRAVAKPPARRFFIHSGAPPIAQTALRRRSRTPTGRARARLGQNFLVDRRVARRVVQAADVRPEDRVLEIGPGRGALTRDIAARAKEVVAVELDSRLARRLQDTLADVPNLSIVEADALAFDPRARFDGEYKLIANLPYYIATPIIRRCIAIAPRPSSLTVMVQREVAQSLTAAPGRMTFLTVAARLYAEARVLFTVPPRAFRPAPKVISAVVRIEPRDSLAVPVDDPADFLEFAAAGFRAPRKRIRNSLRHGLDAAAQEVDNLLKSADVDGARRPADLTLSEWAALYAAWRGSKQCI